MEKWSVYHRRSLVETKMHCIKLLGDKLSARSFDSQVNEIHARVTVLNRFIEFLVPEFEGRLIACGESCELHSKINLPK